MPHHYARVLRPLQLLTVVTLLLRSLPLVSTYSDHVPDVPSVCDDFLTSHRSGAATHSAWVELHDIERKNVSCYTNGTRYKIVIKSTGYVKGFLLGVNRGSFLHGNEVTREREFAVSVKCNNKLGNTISHGMIVPRAADLSFTYNSPPSGTSILEIRAAITFSYEENLENLKFKFPICPEPLPTSSAIEPLPSTTAPQPTSTFKLSTTSDLLTTSETSGFPSPTPESPCQCTSFNPSCGKRVDFYFDKRNHTDGTKNYTCTTRIPIRKVTCNSTCTTDCLDSDCDTPVDLVCKADSQVKRKKYICQEVDGDWRALAGVGTVIKRLELTIYPRCSCRQYSL